MKQIGCRVTGVIRRIGAIALLFNLGLGFWLAIASPAVAALHTYPEGTDQVMVRSLQTLRDETDRAWQLALYKRLKAGNLVDLRLRLVGFPGAVSFSHAQPLAIALGAGEMEVAPDVTPTDFSPNVGEYDLRQVMALLDTAVPIRLMLPIQPAQTTLLIPPFAMREWQQVSRWEP